MEFNPGSDAEEEEESEEGKNYASDTPPPPPRGLACVYMRLHSSSLEIFCTFQGQALLYKPE